MEDLKIFHQLICAVAGVIFNINCSIANFHLIANSRGNDRSGEIALLEFQSSAISWGNGDRVEKKKNCLAVEETYPTLRNSVLRQVRDSAPPFRVLEKCQELCLRDRTATNNLVRACTSFDFQPGSRIASFSGAAEYEESICYLTREQAQPEGIGNLMLVPNSVHFTEVCLACKYSHER